jgi:hypothetical protein
MMWIIILVLGALVQYTIAWWCMPLVALFVSALMGQEAKPSIIHPFLAGFTLWGSVALWRYMSYEGPFFDQVGQLMSLPKGWILLIITALLGGLLACLGGYTGYCIRKAIKK